MGQIACSLHAKHQTGAAGMGFESFAGLLLIGAGPLIVLYVACIAPKSFLVLLSLGRYVLGIVDLL